MEPTEPNQTLELKEEKQKRREDSQKDEEVLLEGWVGSGVEQQVARINPSTAPPTHKTHTHTHADTVGAWEECCSAKLISY